MAASGTYEVKQSSGKGLGLFAKDDIIKGTRIFAESPLFLMPHFDKFEPLHAFMRNLSAPIMEKLLQLSVPKNYSHAGEWTSKALEYYKKTEPFEKELVKRDVTAISTWAVNSFSAGDEASGIFQTACRINHSCLPNVCHCWNPILQQLTVHAVRDIKAGEELHTTYINGACRPKKFRQNELKRYDFTCNCDACADTPFGRRSDSRRSELLSLDQVIAMFEQMPFPSPLKDMRGLLRAADRILEGLEEEGYHSRDLANACSDAAKAASHLNRKTTALKYAGKEVDIQRYCVGDDHPDYQRALQKLDEIKQKLST